MRTVSILSCCLLSVTIAAAEPPALSERYRDDAGRLIGAALTSEHGHRRLGELCDDIGHRLSGSKQLDRAIDWAVTEMRADGLANVRTQHVMVPHWVRGEESAQLVAPLQSELALLGLGGTVGTPPGGIEADVVVVGSFDELEALGAERVRGRIVVFDVPFTRYGETVQYRTKGPSAAARLGAAAALVRSVGPGSLQTPHTGATRYADDAPRIPAAAITIETATQLHRYQTRGVVPRVRLTLGARTLPDAPSANVIAEVPGSEWPDEVVLVGGHLDSWDVGQGAQDDGAGCLIAWEAARLIQRVGLRPRRTVRVVLFTNEENGLRGGNAYADEHDVSRHVAVIESDSGNGQASGFRLQVPPAPEGMSEAAGERWKDEITARALGLLNEMAPLLEPVGAASMVTGYSGADVGPAVRQGVAGLGLNHDTSDYFLIHHTRADTFEKVDLTTFNRNVAAMAVMAYVLADMPERLVDAAAVAPTRGIRSNARTSFGRR